MGHLTKNNRIMTLPPNPDFDINELLKWLIGSTGLLGGYWKYIDNKFKEKKLAAELAKLDKEEFIDRVVKNSMNAVLADLKQDLHEFKTETKAAMKEFNGTVLKIYSEVKK